MDKAEKKSSISNATQKIVTNPKVAVEFSGKVNFRAIRVSESEFFAEGQDVVCEGSLLEVNTDGAIIDTADLMPENSIIGVDLELANGETARNALAKIKRVDQVDGQMILGISFLTLQSVEDELTANEVDLLDECFMDFTSAVKAATAKSESSPSKKVSQ